MLEEIGLPYEVRPVNIGKNEQFSPEFPAIAAMHPLFRDVSDHIRRVQEEIESLREYWPSPSRPA